MGKNLIQQARGKGTPRYRCPSWNFVGSISLPKATNIKGKIVEIIDCPGHYAPLAKINYEDGETILIPAPFGVEENKDVECGENAPIASGNILPLKAIPEGVAIYGLEAKPFGGSKFCRTSGAMAKIVTKTAEKAIVELPSKKTKELDLNCRAIIGTVAGGGRKEKPVLKAGIAFYKFGVKNKKWPRTKACAMNAVDHPFGNKRTRRKAKQKPVSRFAPPGRKVGLLWPRQTGKKK